MSRIDKFVETENRLVVATGEGRVTASGYLAPFGGDEKALILLVVMVAQLCDYTRNPLDGWIACMGIIWYCIAQLPRW